MQRLSWVAALGVAVLCLGSSGRAALATGVTGFYYTGESTSGTALGQGAGTPTVANSGQADASWLVTYASTNGGSSAASTYEGTSYVINTTNSSYTESQYPVGAGYWAANTSQAEWITAPGAVWANSSNTGSGAINSGGDGLPGYGTDTTKLAYNNGNSVVYVYTTTFTITGTGTGAITGFTLNLNVSADNSFAIFVNPTTSAAFLSTSTAAYVSGVNAYTSASAIALTSGFVVGQNTISIEVQNAAAGSAYQNNYSGLLVYGAGFVGLPEYGTWLPLAAAVALYGCWAWRRSHPRSSAAVGLG